MNRNKRTNEKRQYGKDRNGKPYQKRGGKNRPSTKNEKREESGELLDAKGLDNDPNWYFTDAAMADQVSQLSFQQLAGYPIDFGSYQLSVPNMVKVELNPCPGVINSSDYGSALLNKSSGINLAGFRIFSKLSAYTGRTATYGPQDISTMILAMGEVITVMEWIRRAFGVANAYSLRNRSYPREAITWGMMIDIQDFFANFANYRTRFNTLVTMVNQLPIPVGIKYFEKCRSLYEKVYVDADSSMAQSIFTNPFTTWILDESSDPRGSILATTPWHSNAAMNDLDTNVKTMKNYLDTADLMIGALLNSSSLQVVYTDLLNLSLKVGQTFWKMDYLPDGYLVTPEYNPGILLQIHNSSWTGEPVQGSELTSPHVTKLNDVVPNANTNSLYYNPGFSTMQPSTPDGRWYPRTNDNVIIDMMTDTPTVVDRVECTRYCSISGTTPYGTNNTRACDAVLPDHYITGVSLYYMDSSLSSSLRWCNTSIFTSPRYKDVVSAASQITAFPRVFELNASTFKLTGIFAGDLNFYTVVDSLYLRRLHQFMTLGLYDLRKGDPTK